MDICNDVNFLRTIYFVKNIITIGRVVVPFVLIIMCSIDLYKVIVKKLEIPSKVIVNRFIAAIAVFLIPFMLDTVLTSLGNDKVGETVCWVNANEEAITLLQDQLDYEMEVRVEAERVRREALKAERDANRKLRDERIEASKFVAPSIPDGGSGGYYGGGSSGGSGSVSYDPNFMENGTDGKVVVEYGIFYKPSTYTSGSDGTMGSAPYGYNKFFYARLMALVDAAAAAGHSISVSTSNYGAWRPISVQNYYWNCYKTKSCNNGNLAAQPGTSNHGWGIASDLSFSSVSAIYWAHDNAASFGLAFPLCQNVRGNCQENWHIEPTYIVKR